MTLSRLGFRGLLVTLILGGALLTGCAGNKAGCKEEACTQTASACDPACAKKCPDSGCPKKCDKPCPKQ